MDAGIITDLDASLVIDKNKIRRAKLKTIDQSDKTNVTGIYFDGRKDQTKTLMANKSGSVSQATVTQEHYVIISEPGSGYFDHVTPKSGTAKDIAEAIFFLYKKTTQT